MGFLSRVLRLGKAQGEAVITNLEAGKEVELTDVDIKEAEADEHRVMGSLGEVKATIAGIKRRTTELETQQAQYEGRAVALAQKDERELAERNAQEAQHAAEQIAVQQGMLATQDEMERTLRTRLSEIQDRIRQAKNDRQLIASMDSVVKATNTARSTLAHGESTALQRIQDRRNRLQHQMDSASAATDLERESSGDSLEEATEAALGNSGGSAALDSLLARKGGSEASANT